MISIRQKQIIENNKNVRGIIVLAISGEEYKFLDDLLMPIVIVGQNIGTKRSNLFFDDYNSMQELIKSKSINSAIFIGYNEEDATMMRRYQAACDQLERDLDYITMSNYGTH